MFSSIPGDAVSDVGIQKEVGGWNCLDVSVPSESVGKPAIHEDCFKTWSPWRLGHEGEFS